MENPENSTESLKKQHHPCPLKVHQKATNHRKDRGAKKKSWSQQKSRERSKLGESESEKRKRHGKECLENN